MKLKLITMFGELSQGLPATVMSVNHAGHLGNSSQNDVYFGVEAKVYHIHFFCHRSVMDHIRILS